MSLYRVTVTTSGWTGGPGFAQHFFQPDGDPSVVTSDGALRVVQQVQQAYFQASAMWPTVWIAQVSNAVDIINPVTGSLVSSFSVAGQTPITGAGGSNFGPAAIGMVVTWITESIVNGHRVRGRTFLSPIGQQGDGDGSPTALQMSQSGTFATALRNFPNTFEDLVIWHRPKLTLPGSAHVVTGHRVRDKFAVLRSRRD